MKKLMQSGLALAIVLSLGVGGAVAAQETEPTHDAKPLLVTVVSTEGDEVIVRTEDGERMRVRFAPDMPVLERDLVEGDVVKLWTERGDDGELLARVEFAEVGVVKPHVTTTETLDPIANTTDPEATPSETDPVVVDPALTSGAMAADSADSARAGERQADDDDYTYDNRPVVTRVVTANGRENVVVRTENGETWRLKISEDLPVLDRDLQEGDIVHLWMGEDENGDKVARVKYSEVAVIEPHVTTSETTDPIANFTDPEAVFSEIDPVVVDPVLTRDFESEDSESANTSGATVTYEAQSATAGQAEWNAERPSTERETRPATSTEPAETERVRYTARESLPRTASTRPLMALLGAASVIGAFAIRFVGRIA